MRLIDIIGSIICLTLLGAFAISTFILAKHKEEIWKGLYEDNDTTDTTYNK